METIFTKVKWKTLDKATFDSYQNVWSKALYIDGFNFCMYISGRTEEEVNANAKLIAAAPDLLNACVDMIKYFDQQYMSQCDAYFNMKSLIKKATE